MKLIDRLDRAVGVGVERAICTHHARRLRRIGWQRALDPPPDGVWAAGDPPPREGCAVDVLIDGEKALPRIAQAVRGARESVLVPGWHASPDFAIERGGEGSQLREMLAE